MRKHLERLTDRLPMYHDDEVLSTNSTTSPSHSNKTAAGTSADNKETSLDNVVSENHRHIEDDHIPLHENPRLLDRHFHQHPEPTAPSEVQNVNMLYGT